MSQHVPAWKKLGLKLKYAKDTADDAPASVATAPAETNGNSHAGAKRPREDDIGRDQGSTKKHKKHSKPVIDTTSEPPAVKGILSGSQSPTKTPAKKSVQFSAETKAEDGETGQNYFKAWAAGQPHTPPKTSIENSMPETPDSAEKANAEIHESPAEVKAKTKASIPDPKADQTAAPTQDPNDENQPSLEERRKSKAAKKAAKQERKAQTQAQQPTATVTTIQTPQSAYLSYLHQFHHDKRNWKFNKSKENHLLKNAWSTYRVPAPYTDALIGYIAGLQGAGARGRLVEGADWVLQDVSEKNGQKFDFSGYEEPSTRREAYSSAVKRLRESSSGQTLSQEDVDRVDRAEAVLAQLLNHAPAPVAKPTTVTSAGGAKRIQFADDEDEPAPAPAPAAKLPARRKRKARTDVSSDESSSDSSSSESESDTDSDSDSDGSSSEDSSNSDGSSGSDNDSSDSD